MYKKNYGRVTLSAWLQMELCETRPAFMAFFGILMLAGGILVRFCTGAPYLTLLAFDIGDLVPPVWVMTFLWSLAFLTVGGAGGAVLGHRSHGCEVDKYKGGMLFVILTVLEFCFYPTFFGAQMVFLAVIECILILCFAIGVTVCFYRVSRFAGMLMLLHDIWLIYMLILMFAVFFRT